MPTSLHPIARDYAARRAAERRTARNVLVGGLLLSVLIHFVALQLLEFRVDIQRVQVLRPPRAVQITPEMQAYDVVTVTGDVAPIEIQVRERLELPDAAGEPVMEAPAAPGEVPATSAPASGQSRIEYRMSAPQVWRPAPAIPLNASAADYNRERVAARLEQYNDSVAAEAAAAARARDWTTTDADGNRWGVSPGKIHLGALTLPFLNEFAPPPGRREEIAGRIRTWGEIQDQVVRLENKEIVDDRVKAIRARMEAERLRKLQGGGGG